MVMVVDLPPLPYQNRWEGGGDEVEWGGEDEGGGGLVLTCFSFSFHLFQGHEYMV